MNDHYHKTNIPNNFLNKAKQFYEPLAKIVINYQKSKDQPIILGISGCQGSGKTTLASYLDSVFQNELKTKSINLSLDDFYLSHKERKKLAKSIHPLLSTRGVPGTHNVGLLQKTIKSLFNKNTSIKIPKFNKATDDLFPEDLWPEVSGLLDIIILEGWCLGAEAVDGQELEKPINTLEKGQDNKGIWRRFVNDQLKTCYKNLFNHLDYLIYLQAPDFNCVYHWRKKQEQQLQKEQNKDIKNKCMNDEELKNFILHFERITRQCMEQLPKKADVIVKLDKNQTVINII